MAGRYDGAGEPGPAMPVRLWTNGLHGGHARAAESQPHASAESGPPNWIKRHPTAQALLG